MTRRKRKLTTRQFNERVTLAFGLFAIVLFSTLIIAALQTVAQTT